MAALRVVALVAFLTLGCVLRDGGRFVMFMSAGLMVPALVLGWRWGR